MAEWHQGPWQAIETDDGEWIIKSAYDLVIGQVPSLFTPERERANATVMAAAPDMVETLENLLGLFVYNYERDTGRSAEQDIAEVRDAKAALAKAKGQGG